MTNKLPVVGKRYKSISNNCEIEVLAFTQSGTVLINHSFWGEVEQILEEFWNCFEELPEDKPETKPEAQLEQIKKIYKEYSQPNSFIDSGNLYYALGNAMAIIEELNKNNNKGHVSELSLEVKQAMEELRGQLEHGDRFYSDIEPIAQNLLNALGKQFNCNGYFEGLPPSKEAIERSKQEEVVDNTIKGGGQIVTPLEEEVEEESMEATVKESLTVWKPVSELEYYEDEPVQTVLVKYQNGRINLRGNNAAFVGDEKFCRIGDFINDYEKLKERVKKLEGND